MLIWSEFTMELSVNDNLSSVDIRKSRQLAKNCWLFPGIWIGAGALISMASLLGTTVSDVLGVPFSKLPFYNLTVVYRSNLPLIHVLAPIFLLLWILQGYFMFYKPKKIYSYVFMGFNAFSFIVWIFSFWGVMNAGVFIIILVISLSLIYSIKVFPWNDSLKINILQNLNLAEREAKDTNRELQRKSEFLNEILQQTHMHNNDFSQSLENFSHLSQDIFSRINFSKKQLEKDNLDYIYLLENSKELVKNAQDLKNEPIFQFNITEEIMDKKIQELQRKFELLSHQYLPSELINIRSSDNTSSMIPINTLFLDDCNIMQLFKKQSTSELSVKKFLDYCNIIDERLDQIKEYIAETTETKVNALKTLEEKLYGLEELIDENFRIPELRDRFKNIRLKPIESKLKTLKIQNNNLTFENEMNQLKLLEIDLKTTNEEIKFIITILLMDKAKKPLSILGELNAKQKEIINDGELNIKGYLKNINPIEKDTDPVEEQTDLVGKDNDLKDDISSDKQKTDKEEIAESVKSKKEILDKLNGIRPIFYILKKDSEKQPEKNEFMINCDSTEAAEFLCEFINTNCPNSLVTCVMTSLNSKTVVFNFSLCKNDIGIEVEELFNSLNENLWRVKDASF